MKRKINSATTMSVKIQKNQRKILFSCLELLAIDLKERIEVGSILDSIREFRCIYSPYMPPQV